MARAMRKSLPIALALMTLGPALGLAGSESRQEASYELSQERPGRSSAERFAFDYVNPDDPEAKPLAVQKVVTILPRGAYYDATVPGSCTASDAELMATGGNACPTRSAIGGGVLTIDTGFPEPARFVTVDVEFFNNATDAGGEFIYLNTVRGTGARTVIRADVTRRRTITEAGMLPGTPPDGGAIDTVDVTVEDVSAVVGGKRRNYITTPPRCQERGFWLTRVRFKYPDGVSQTVRDHSRCEG
jgi:hypothetical protein